MEAIPRRFDAKLIVGRPDGARSSLWHVWRTKNEVYVASSNFGRIEKLSFHSGGICRKAFTTERGVPNELSDRLVHKWRRAETPPRGFHSGSCVLEVGFPTNYLSTTLEQPDAQVIWIPAAPNNMATVLEMFFTHEPEDVLRSLMKPFDRSIHVCTRLPNGETFMVASRIAAFNGENFRIPTSHHHSKDFIISDNDPNNTGRPIRVTIFTNPKDGDRMTVWEYGAYKAEPHSVEGLETYATFTRKQVYDTTGWNH
jgi:hypothetical protein